MNSTIPPAGADIACVGETMALLVPGAESDAAGHPTFTASTGGAESNVAVHLARRGHRVAWVSAVGDDRFGRLVLGRLAAEGVDVTGVRVDPGRPTGVYLKEPAVEGRKVTYYRTGSAASGLSQGDLTTVTARRPKIVHTTGITPVLSATTRLLVDGLFGPARPELLSFDVNHRAALHTKPEHTELLLSLARAADLVFVGDDEAEVLWGTHSPSEVRSLLADVPLLVVKQGPIGATAYQGDEEFFVPAHQVDVVDVVGAGDAFAAGFLHGLTLSADPRTCLRHGHDFTVDVLRVKDDLGPAPVRS
ncbi:MAG TPA: sugar kinase [Actinokineospora sp.]|nr:sugar kinase [Actinokineospora sp.]